MKRAEREEEQRASLWEELLSHRDETVIVEGKKDAEALQALGFTHVLTINRGKGLYDFSVDVKATNGDLRNSVSKYLRPESQTCELSSQDFKNFVFEDCTTLVLTDFDPEGERLAKKLDEYLRSVGCQTNKNARNRLRILFLKNKLTTVQGLRRFNSND